MSSAPGLSAEGLLDPAGYGGGFREWATIDASQMFAAYEIKPQSGYPWLLVCAFLNWTNPSGTDNTNPNLALNDPSGGAVWLGEMAGSTDAGRQGRATWAVGDGAQYGVTGAGVQQAWHAPLPLLVLDPGYFIYASAIANPNNNAITGFTYLVEYYDARGGGGGNQSELAVWLQPTRA